MSGRPLLYGLDGRTVIAVEKPHQEIGEKAVNFIVELFGSMQAWGQASWDPSPQAIMQDPSLLDPRLIYQRTLDAMIATLGAEEMTARVKGRWGLDIEIVDKAPTEPAEPESTETPALPAEPV